MLTCSSGSFLRNSASGRANRRAVTAPVMPSVSCRSIGFWRDNVAVRPVDVHDRQCGLINERLKGVLRCGIFVVGVAATEQTQADQFYVYFQR